MKNTLKHQLADYVEKTVNTLVKDNPMGQDGPMASRLKTLLHEEAMALLKKRLTPELADKLAEQVLAESLRDLRNRRAAASKGVPQPSIP